MPQKWETIHIEAKWFTNVHETAMTRAQAAIENGFQNEAKGHTRFPGLESFATLTGDPGRVYLHEWRGNLMAATSHGNLWRIDQGGNVENVTKVPIAGGRRPIFAKTTDELVIAAGKKPVRFAGETTEILSEDAPDTTHVGFIDNYLVAIESYSGRFRHTEAGIYREWPALDVFSTDGKPDDLNCLVVTKFRELILGGVESIEQFERLASGDTPFFRRWSIGDGIYVPYSVVFADNGVWHINADKEFNRFSGQTAEPHGEDIGRTLEAVDDWKDAWVGGHPDRPLHVLGQKFLLLQAPFATNPYGTKGLTLLFDYRNKRWYSLYGWDSETGTPNRWPGWSYWPIWNNVYVGGEGVIYKLTTDTYTNDGEPQRMLGRTAHISEWGHCRVDELRARVRRGVGSYTADPIMRIRANRDNEGFRAVSEKGLGKSGEREMTISFGGFGCAHSWQFQWEITDDCAVELVRLDALVTRLGR